MMNALEAKLQIARLLKLKPRVTGQDLADNGVYFADTCADLTQSTHGDTGYFGNGVDGQAVAILWNLWRAGRLVGHLDAPAERAKVVAQEQVGNWVRVGDLLAQAAGLLKECRVTSGVCVCGTEMSRHYDQDACGHLPDDEAAHSARRWVKAYESLLADARLAEQTAAHEPKP